MIKSILNILSYVGMALVFGAVAVRLYVRLGGAVAPTLEQNATYAAWAGLALVILYTLGQWREIAAYFQRRNARYGAIAGLSVVIAIAALIAANWVSNRQNKRWDLTANKQYTLSDQTVNLLRGLDSPLRVLVFDLQTRLDGHRANIEQYRYHSSQVAVEYIDPERRPLEAEKYEIREAPTFILEYMGRRERASAADERQMANTLIKLLKPQARKVYFLQGHGEKDPTSKDRGGFAGAAGQLQQDNYQTDRLVLAQQRDVPNDATVVVIAGPTSDLLPQEVEALKRYLARAGKLMVLIDPQVGPNAMPLPALTALVHDWGIDVGNNLVVDITGAADPSTAIAVEYPHQAAEALRGQLTMYPLARSIDPVSAGVNGRFAQPVVQTSQASWAEVDLNVEGGVKPEPEKGDKNGPITIAAAVAAPADSAPAPAAPPAGADAPPKPETRVMVFGDSDFASNNVGGVPGNLNLFGNSVNWLAQQEDLISIQPREAGDRRITLTGNQLWAMQVLTIIVIPAAVLVAGIVSWWRRR
jgi:ABC-type uncharacterized transport system involved in gliding motility auxiliary subunit